MQLKNDVGTLQHPMATTTKKKGDLAIPQPQVPLGLFLW